MGSHSLRSAGDRLGGFSGLPPGAAIETFVSPAQEEEPSAAGCVYAPPGGLSARRLAEAVNDVLNRSPEQLEKTFLIVLKAPDYRDNLIEALRQMVEWKTPPSRRAYEKAMGVIRDLFAQRYLPPSAFENDIALLSGSGAEKLRADAAAMRRENKLLTTYMRQSAESLQRAMAQQLATDPESLARSLQGLAARPTERANRAFGKGLLALEGALQTADGGLTPEGREFISLVARLSGPGAERLQADTAAMRPEIEAPPPLSSQLLDPEVH